MARNLKQIGDLSHINPEEDRLLAQLLPRQHGRVITEGLLADAGRGGDDRLTLVTPEEAAILKLFGGSGLPNPQTGLLAYEAGAGGSPGSGGGEDGNNGAGSVGGGSSSGGMGGGGMGGGGSVGGDTGFGDHSSLGGPESEIGGPGMGFGGGYGPGGFFSENEDFTKEDEIGFAATQPNWNEYNFVNYAPKNTWERVFQEWWDPSLPSPGRFSAPTRDNLGFLTDMMGHLGFGALGKGVMGFGAAMGRAQSIDEQNASMAHNQALGSQNSTGQDRDSSTGLSLQDGLLATGQQQAFPTFSPDQGLLADNTATTSSPTPAAVGAPPVVIVQKDKKRADDLMKFIWSGEVNPNRWLV